ncbi:hypothetical protein SLA2020_438710 [Shorea laevis]
MASGNALVWPRGRWPCGLSGRWPYGGPSGQILAGGRGWPACFGQRPRGQPAATRLVWPHGRWPYGGPSGQILAGMLWPAATRPDLAAWSGRRLASGELPSAAAAA